MSRPIAVTVVCWVIVALSLEALIGLASGLVNTVLHEMAPGNSLSTSATIWFGVGGAIINIALAGLMLRGVGWARIVYFVLASIGVLGVFILKPPIALIFSAIFKVVVFAYFLFGHDANLYFSASTKDVNPPRSLSA